MKATHFSSVLARLVGLGLMAASTISPAFAAEKKSPAKKVETEPAPAAQPSRYDLETWGTIKPVKDTDFWEFTYLEIEKGRAKRVTAFVRLVEGEATYFQDKIVPLTDLAEGNKLWVFGRRFEQEAPSATGYMGTDRQMKNVAGAFVGESLMVNTSFKNPKDPESRWYEVTVSEPGASINVKYDSLDYKVVLLRSAPVVKREKIDAPPKLKSGLRVALGLVKSEERPDTKKSADAKKESYLVKAVFLLDPRILQSFYPMVYQ